MGAWLSTEKWYAAIDHWPGLRKTRVSHEETQTPVLFTDRLSDYGNREVGSTEAIDHVCDICDKQDREAVGYCRQCEQYYCFNCCQGHEKMTLSKRHSLVGKTDFPSTDDNDTLFVRQVVLASVQTIPHDYAYNTSIVRCIAFLESPGHIVALDKYNYSCPGNYHNVLKITEKDGGTFKVSLESNNIHMILCSPRKSNVEVLLTLTGKKEVQKCSIDKESTTPVTYFKTSGDCYGIAEFNSGYAVSINLVMGYSLPVWHVQYLDSEGYTKKQIFYDSQKTPLFCKPKYLASNQTQDVLYVSDVGKHAVIALDVCGNVLFTFTHSDMRNPMALTVDDEDNAYVACGENVVQIHKSGTKHRVLIQKEKNKPRILSVCFNSVSRALIVGEESNEIKILNFLP